MGRFRAVCVAPFVLPAGDWFAPSEAVAVCALRLLDCVSLFVFLFDVFAAPSELALVLAVWLLDGDPRASFVRRSTAGVSVRTAVRSTTGAAVSVEAQAVNAAHASKLKWK
jgi:hypothetical protein